MRNTRRWSSVCPQCGEQFSPKKASVRYCSKKCANRASAPKRTETRMRNFPARPRRETLHTVVCDICGSSFTSRSSRAKRCSPECRIEAGRRRASARYLTVARPKPRETDACAKCGVALPVGKSVDGRHRRRRWCSTRCQRRQRRKAERKAVKDRRRTYGILLGGGVSLKDYPKEVIEIARLRRQLNQEVQRKWQKRERTHRTAI